MNEVSESGGRAGRRSLTFGLLVLLVVLTGVDPADAHVGSPDDQPAQPSHVPRAHLQLSTASGRPIVYMTFDDGPNPGATVDILNTLARHNARATFFVTGVAVSRYPDVAKRMVDERHAIANHTVNHPQLTALSGPAIVAQFQQTTDQILQATGVRASCYRPPYGATSGRVHGLAKEVGLPNAGWSTGRGGHWGLWDVDTNDWRRGYARTWNALQSTSGGDVVLMHSITSFSSGIFARWMDLNAHRFDFRPLPGCGANLEPALPPDPADWYRYKVARLYLGYFQRMPTNRGARYWNGQYLDGQTLEQISQLFSASPEFSNRYGSLGPGQFVVQAFVNTLGRRPTPTGANYWASRIASGEISRGEFMLQLSESPEFVRISAETVTGAAWTGVIKRSYRRGINLDVIAGPTAP